MIKVFLAFLAILTFSTLTKAQVTAIPLPSTGQELSTGIESMVAYDANWKCDGEFAYPTTGQDWWGKWSGSSWVAHREGIFVDTDNVTDYSLMFRIPMNAIELTLTGEFAVTGFADILINGKSYLPFMVGGMDYGRVQTFPFIARDGLKPGRDNILTLRVHSYHLKENAVNVRNLFLRYTIGEEDRTATSTIGQMRKLIRRSSGR